jgi:hypothetical protein
MKFIQYVPIDVVLGGDHGQRKYRMVTNLIHQNKSDTLKVGHMDCIKNTRTVLKKAIGDKIKDGCKALFGKYLW